jgi:hypothetical protein
MTEKPLEERLKEKMAEIGVDSAGKSESQNPPYVQSVIDILDSNKDQPITVQEHKEIWAYQEAMGILWGWKGYEEAEKKIVERMYHDLEMLDREAGSDGNKVLSREHAKKRVDWANGYLAITKKFKLGKEDGRNLNQSVKNHRKFARVAGLSKNEYDADLERLAQGYIGRAASFVKDKFTKSNLRKAVKYGIPAVGLAALATASCYDPMYLAAAGLGAGVAVLEAGVGIAGSNFLAYSLDGFLDIKKEKFLCLIAVATLFGFAGGALGYSATELFIDKSPDGMFAPSSFVGGSIGSLAGLIYEDLTDTFHDIFQGIIKKIK